MIHIEGYSNFIVKIKNRNNRLIISKSAKNKEEFKRLKIQIEKQIKFENIFIFSKYFYVPRILSSKNFNFNMEYINDSESMINFFENSNIDKIKWITNLLIEFITKNIQLSKFKNILSEFLIKYESVKNNIIKKYPDLINLLKKIDKIFLKLNNIIIPVGLCHGDLTLSNILICFDKQKLFFIDFLDNFIETPFQDIVKIRQDTKYFWSVYLFNKKCDRNKIKINLQYMDIIIDEYFKKYNFYKNYNIYQSLNLLRILPYCKDDNIKNIIISNIKLLLKI